MEIHLLTYKVSILIKEGIVRLWAPVEVDTNSYYEVTGVWNRGTDMKSMVARDWPFTDLDLISRTRRIPDSKMFIKNVKMILKLHFQEPSPSCWAGESFDGSLEETMLQAQLTCPAPANGGEAPVRQEPP